MKPNIFDIIVADVKNTVPRTNGDPFISFPRYALLLHIMDNFFPLEQQYKKANETTGFNELFFSFLKLSIQNI